MCRLSYPLPILLLVYFPVLAAFDRQLQVSITIKYAFCRFMQGLAGVPWAKTYPDNALMARRFGCCPNEGQHAFAPRASSLPCSRRCMPSWHCIRAWEPVRYKLRQDEKVARCNWRSNLPGDLALIHGRGMMRHTSSWCRERAQATHRDDVGFP